ncbi:MAG: endopeptidase La [Gammaproteobacteria bacterium]|nr:endopeptidase La [Gammaproteobacteria bacterium]
MNDTAEPENEPQVRFGALSTAEIVPVVPLRDAVIFPGMMVPLAVGRGESVAAVKSAMRAERPVALLLQKDRGTDAPEPHDLYSIGTLANPVRFLTAPDGSHHLVCQGIVRFRVLNFERADDHLTVYAERLNDPTDEPGQELEAHLLALRQQALEALNLLPQAPDELVNVIGNIRAPGALADLVAGYLDIEIAEKQNILGTLDVSKRIAAVGRHLEKQLEVLRISSRIRQETQESMGKKQREFILREQLQQIRKELGEGDDPKSAEIKELDEAIAKAKMPPVTEEQARNELKRLERMPEAAAEYSMARTYLDWLIEFPWSKRTDDNYDLDVARKVLDEDHYGLEKIKRRIVEFLAVRKRNPEGHAPILCFVGPPGVGKTSLGQSIARAMGRKFERFSLGGMRDEAEIRGHRRTYIGALPGNIVRALKKAGTRNPVLMLDELDKLAVGFQGDPAAALLEVLDPAQNDNFRDSYLDVPVDLSQVIFIGTANVLDQIPGPLRDRLEVIELPGYTETDKLEIAKRYLIARQRKENGLAEEEIGISDDTLRAIIEGYTREAGVRQLEREIAAVCRRITTRIADGEAGPFAVAPDDLHEILGARKFENEMAQRTSVPGVATGLAWTPVGGQILFVEATATPGKGNLHLTGQLGDIMKESVDIALSLIKSRADKLKIDAASLAERDIHVHVPAGAIPKDGPSAGVAMTTALVSLLTNRRVHADLAMTGEITLRGLVLPVGGIKEKVLAAHTAGIKRLILPARNKKDYEDIPEHAREALEFVWADKLEDVLGAAFESE